MHHIFPGGWETAPAVKHALTKNFSDATRRSANLNLNNTWNVVVQNQVSFKG